MPLKCEVVANDLGEGCEWVLADRRAGRSRRRRRAAFPCRGRCRREPILRCASGARQTARQSRAANDEWLDDEVTVASQWVLLARGTGKLHLVRHAGGRKSKVTVSTNRE